ncbi:MAG: hypothetical protein GHCLOJNM_01575 [bacterium]|nr:hypothetical protein [bacterium]
MRDCFKNVALVALMIVMVGSAYALRDQKNRLSAKNSLNSAVYTTGTSNGTGVDLAGYDAATVVISAGAYTNGTHTIHLEDSADNSSYTDVAAGYLIGSAVVLDGTPDQNKAYTIGYIGSKRYLRVASVIGSGATGAHYSATVIRGLPASMPTSNN